MAATLLQIYDTAKVSQYTQTILKFTILAQYILYNNKTLCYMKYTLYKLEKSKIVYEYHWSINLKLY